MSLHSDTHHHLRSKLAPEINLNLDKTLDKMIIVEERQRNVLNSAMGGGGTQQNPDCGKLSRTSSLTTHRLQGAKGGMRA